MREADYLGIHLIELHAEDCSKGNSAVHKITHSMVKEETGGENHLMSVRLVKQLS